MKKLICVYMLLFAATCALADILTPTQRAVLLKRRAVSREFATIDGNECVIVRYKRGAEDDGCTTNVVRSVNGAKQNNPLQNRIEATMKTLAEAEGERDAKAELIAAVRARCVEKRDYYLALEQKAVLKTSKELWRAIADANQEIIDYLDNGGK